MFLMNSINDLWEHIAYVLAYAPDRFPFRDFLSDDEQMNLDRAFDQLRQGVIIAYPEPSFESKRVALYTLLERSYLAYKKGDEIAGGRSLNEFQDNVFKSE
jgi:hypothetical protein